MIILTMHNPAGSLILQMMDLETGFKSIKEQIIKTKTKNNLLQIILNKRLGKEVDLTAQTYSEKYIIDVENKKNILARAGWQSRHKRRYHAADQSGSSGILELKVPYIKDMTFRRQRIREAN